MQMYLLNRNTPSEGFRHVVPEEKVGRNTTVEVDGTCNATKPCPTSEMKVNYKYSMPLHAPVADSDKTHKVCSRSYPRSVWPCPI